MDFPIVLELVVVLVLDSLEWRSSGVMEVPLF
jgi:hypothetical protein